MKKRYIAIILGITLLLASCGSTEIPTVGVNGLAEEDLGPTLVLNGGFENANGWTNNFLGGSTGTAQAKNGEFCWNITDKGTEEWNIQVFQPLPDLEMGKTYRLSFDAYADQAVTVRTALEQNYGDYLPLHDSPAEFDITTSKASYAVDFEVNQEGANGRVRISTGGDFIPEAPATICIDNIYDSLITNGNFDNNRDIGWNKYFLDGAAGETRVENDMLCFDISKKGSDVYMIQLNQDVNVEVGKTYYLGFTGFSKDKVTLRTAIKKNSGDYGYLGTKSVYFTLSGEPKEYRSTVAITKEGNARVNFTTGGQLIASEPANFCIDSIYLREVK
jgi:hypothetical protein